MEEIFNLYLTYQEQKSLSAQQKPSFDQVIPLLNSFKRVNQKIEKILTRLRNDVKIGKKMAKESVFKWFNKNYFRF